MARAVVLNNQSLGDLAAKADLYSGRKNNSSQVFLNCSRVPASGKINLRAINYPGTNTMHSQNIVWLMSPSQPPARAHFPAGKLRRNVLLVWVSERVSAFSLFIWCAAGKINNPLEERDILLARCAPPINQSSPERRNLAEKERPIVVCTRPFDLNAPNERESNC